MIFTSTEKLGFFTLIGLLTLPLFTEGDKIRLVGPSRCSGRLEVFYSNSWGTVCDDSWGLTSAEVACRELSCGTVMEAKTGAFFGQGKDEIWLDDVQCTGHESSILKCPHRPFGENNCGHREDAGIICSEYLRLVNGSNHCSGRVEMFHDRHWKRVCSSDWDMEEARVVCQDLHCGPPAPQTSELLFGAAQGVGGVKTNCVGNETSLSKCQHQELQESCIDATVVCSNDKPIRVVNGTNSCSGRVEIYHAGQWGTICDDHWGMQEANVACRELNCGNAVAIKIKAYFGMGTEQVWMDDIDCTGNEDTLAQCPHRGFGENDCDHTEDAGVICSESVRLTNGTDRCSGRLEVFHDGHWGKICNNNWGLAQAKIVCMELDCGAPKTTHEPLNFGDSVAQRRFTSSCSANVDSISQCKLQESARACTGVFLSCAGVQPMRLVNGTDRCSGRVELYHDGQWGTVCDDNWGIKEAGVVCRTMDCGTALKAPNSAYFGQGDSIIWLDDVSCLGNESSIIHCNHPSFGENNCGHGEDAGVVCAAHIRLLNGTDMCSGRVELYYDGLWSPAVNVNWGMNEARVVCREMNCGDPMETSMLFSQSELLGGYKVSCTGRESSITECTLREYTRSGSGHLGYASVVCSGSVKLVDGPNRCAGRVEVFEKGQWGNVCGETWDMNDAAVVCQELKCGRDHKITTTPDYGHGSGRVWVDQIECNRHETTLSQCTKRPFTDKTCNVSSLAGVVCTDSLNVRLAESTDPCSGRLEVLSGGVWGTVCDSDWTLEKAEVVCALVECGHAVSAPGAAHFKPGTGPVLDSDSCFGNLTTLQKCFKSGFKTSTCEHDKDAGAVCAAPIRVSGGSNACSGRVEIFYKGQWGTVCDDDWTLVNAKVLCRQLGCGQELLAPTGAHFGPGEGPIWLDNVACTGDEIALTQCQHPPYGVNNCGHSEDASVICLGALHKPQITFSPGPEVNWGDQVEVTCTIVTEQLGGTFILSNSQGSVKMEKYSENEAVIFTFPKVDFSQKGSYFCDFKKKVQNQVISYPQSNVADLTVTVKLEKPSITLSSPHTMMIYSLDEISVNRGEKFFITCSVHSPYPGGFFYLTKSNTSRSEPKAAFGHSIFYLANFEISATDYEQHAQYSCVYSVNISSQAFCSDASKAIRVTVVAASASSAVSGIVAGIVVMGLLVVIGYIVWRKKRWGAGTMVTFSNIQQNMENRRNRPLDNSQDHSPQAAHRGFSRVVVVEDRNADVDMDSSVEREPEDLAGKVCYELEPLVAPL